MANGNISVIKIRDILLVTVPSDPDDCTVSELQEQVLSSMERHSAKGLILDISTVETIDSFFARTVSETVKMVALMGGLAICWSVMSSNLSFGMTMRVSTSSRRLSMPCSAWEDRR